MGRANELNWRCVVLNSKSIASPCECCMCSRVTIKNIYWICHLNCLIILVIILRHPEIPNLGIAEWGLTALYWPYPACSSRLLGFLFTNRFLQQRRQLLDVSIVNSGLADERKNLIDITWFPPNDRKAVIILFDSLKWDIVDYDESIPKGMEKSSQNKLVVFHDVLKNQPDNSMLMKLYSDAPIFTSIRLKCMMSGTLPSFVDSKDNLAPKPVIFWSCFL